MVILKALILVQGQDVSNYTAYAEGSVVFISKVFLIVVFVWGLFGHIFITFYGFMKDSKNHDLLKMDKLNQHDLNLPNLIRQELAKQRCYIHRHSEN